LDYIVKPLTQQRFDAAVARARSFFDIRQRALQYEHYIDKDTVVVQEGYDTHKILLSDIVYLEALKDYTRIFTKKRSYVTLGNLSRTLESLSIQHFLRVHRSYAVNARQALSIVDNNIQLEDKMIPIGKTYRNIVNEIKKNY
jgi:DNA-binding LytR/AlgR family response regulator